MLLTQATDGTAAVAFHPVPVRAARSPTGRPTSRASSPVPGRGRRDRRVARHRLLRRARGIDGATILIAKQDPGQGIVWLAFGSLIAGLLITFYLPRRRVWTRLARRRASCAIVGRSDRYVDFERRVRPAARRPRRGRAPAPNRAPARPAGVRPMATCGTCTATRSSRRPEPLQPRSTRHERRTRGRLGPGAEGPRPGLRRARARRPGDRPASALAVVAPGAEPRPRPRRGAPARPRSPARPVSSEVRRTTGVVERARAAALGADRAWSALPGRPASTRNQLERSVIGFLVNRRAELEHQAALLEAQLARLALLGRGLAALVGGDRVVLRAGRRPRGPARRSAGGPCPGRCPGGGRGGPTYLARPRAPLRSCGVRIPAGGRGESRSLGRPARAPRRSSGERARAGRRPSGSPRCSPWSWPATTAVRQARDDVRRGEPLPRDGPPWVVLVARQVARRRCRTTSPSAGRDPGRAAPARPAAPAGSCGGRARASSCGSSSATGPDDPEGLGLTPIAWPASWPDRGDLAAVRRAGATGRPPRPSARATLGGGGAARRRRRPSPVLPGCPRTGAGQLAQPARRSAPGTAAPRADPRRSARDAAPSGWPRSRRCSSPVGSVKQPPRSGSTATRSPTGPAGSSGSAAGTSRPGSRSRPEIARQTCAKRTI